MEETTIVYPQRIRDIRYIESEFSGKTRSFDQITFFLDFQRIDFYSVNDTDEISVKVSNIKNHIIRESNNLFPDYFIGQELYITWKCINSQGYFDLFVIGIGTIRPTICILSEGSSLKVLKLEKE